MKRWACLAACQACMHVVAGQERPQVSYIIVPHTSKLGENTDATAKMGSTCKEFAQKCGARLCHSFPIIVL